MPLIDIKINPTKTDLRVFAALWLVFFGVLGLLALGRPSALFGAGMFTGACFLISITLNSEHPRRLQLLGVTIPLALLAIGGAEQYLGVNPWAIASVLWAFGVVGAAATLLSPVAGRTLYTGWMYAALPIGWTISHVILGGVYYLVITPIGLLLRLAGNDPMHRRFDRGATTYWIPRERLSDPSRYFKQF